MLRDGFAVILKARAQGSLSWPLLFILSCFLYFTASFAVIAQPAPFPLKPIRLIVGYPAGGASDVAARIVAQKLSERLMQSVVVENRPGSAGNIGAELAAKSVADGYTLLLATISLSINPSLYAKLSYDPIKDFSPISMISSTPFLLVVNTKSPFKNAKDFLETAKGKGALRVGEINYASAGNGSGSHLFTELLSTSGGLRMTHIPYKGAAPAVNDLLASQVDVAFDNIMTSLPLVRAGKLRALAVSTKSRSSVAPDIPTLDEVGLNGFDANAWFGLFAPSATPREIINLLSVQVAEVLKDSAVTDKMLQLGAEPMSSSPEAFATFFKSEVNRWAKVVQLAKVQID